MSAALLAQLKIKKQPDVLEKVEVVIPLGAEPPVALAPYPRQSELGALRPAIAAPIVRAVAKPPTISELKIVDKTKTSGFDRAAFMNALIEKKGVTVPLPQVKPPGTIVMPIVPSEETETIIIKKPVKKLVKKAPLKIMEEVKAVEPLEVVVAASETVAPVAEEPVLIKVKKVIKRKTKAPIGVIREGPLSMIKIGDATIEERLGLSKKEPSVLISASSYYMNNREKFIDFTSALFGKYKKDLAIESESATCSYDENAPFTLMTHQKIVRDYLNLITPYRGVLLYHGLGSGKTCSSIAIAEGMKSNKQVIVMTPAALRMNFIEELKKCGDSLYRKNQYWEFIDITENPELLTTMSNVLSLSVEYIRKQGGVWLSNITKPSNFEKGLTTENKSSLDNQLNEMIRYKYQFINYNGLRMAKLEALTHNYTKNLFDNCVVIIDEAHNFVSRIVNKLTKKETVSGKLYEYLMNAQNAKIVLLTGTPIINYPNEIAILFNILRGKIKTWYFKLTIEAGAGAGAASGKVSQEFFQSLFKTTILGGNVLDYMEYKPTSTTLVITRNPFGFVNKTKEFAYDGVYVNDRGEMDDANFVKYITGLLAKNNIKVVTGSIRVELYKALPDDLDEFKNYFIDPTGEVKNMNLFKRRILGLPSYFRSAQEGLMPRFEKSTDFHVVNVEMSNFQFGIYEEARIAERKLELQNAKKKKQKAGKEGVYDEAVSTYRIFSRAFCNFVFPRPAIRRPMPNENDNLETAIISEAVSEDILDVTSATEKLDQSDGTYDADDIAKEEEKAQGAAGAAAAGADAAKLSYQDRINAALADLELHKKEYLTPEALLTYSPKFLNILENIQDESHVGLHLIYSQFRTLEGIGILKLVLEANGFAQFKIRKVGDVWQLAMTDEELAKPKFALYTGTETAEEKEIIRNIFNGAWKYVPEGIASKLQPIATSNMYGEIIKVLMITSSGAEGISLKNVRYVHITEPYWHPVRTEQVIGRARRICSHQDLPEELRTVEVFLYLMVFTKEQLKSEASIELLLKDKSKIDDLTPISTDQALYEIATIKENITNKILAAVKEASFDCTLHSKAGAKEQVKCFSFGKVNSNKFSYHPSMAEEEADVVADRNKVTITWKAVDLEIAGIKYALNKESGDVYDLDSYTRGQPIQVGKLVVTGKGKGATYKFEKAMGALPI